MSQRDRLVAGPRQRAFDDQHHGPDSRALFWVLLCLSTFLLIAATSCAQVSSEERALDLIAAGVATTSDLDALLAEQYEPLRELVEETDDLTYTIPGFPVEVVLAREEILQLSQEQLRQLVLQRSSAIVYEQGLDAFDRTGEQSVSTFSLQGLGERTLGWVDATAHDRAVVASWILLGVAVLGALGVLATGRGFDRFRSFGLAIVFAALPGLLASFAASFVVGRIGGSDPFSEDVRTILETVLAVFRRNYLVALVFGMVVAASGPLLALASRRMGYEADPHGEFEPELVRGPRRR